LAKLDAKKESLEEKISEIKERIAERESILTPVLEKLRSKVSIPEGATNPFEQVRNTLRGKIERFEKEYKRLQQRLQELGNLRAALQKEIELLQRRREELQRRYGELTAEVEKQREILRSYLPEGYTAEVERLKEQLKKLKELREQLHRREGEIVQLKERIEQLKTLIARADDYSPQVLEETEEQLKRLQERLEEVKTAEVENLHRLKELEKLLQERKKLEEEIQQLRSRFNLLKTLRDDFRADRLQRFVVAKALNDIAEAAGYFLNKLSDGRYTFVLQEEELLVYDSHEDAIRKVQTLSGGETFLASLSFALGFGQYVGGNASVESLFIDEGFGTLDAETLGRVEEIFEIIRSKVNKTIGVITHLDALAEIFDKRVEVKRTPEGSKIEVVNAIENS
jgi:exonuclease SbcC